MFSIIIPAHNEKDNLQKLIPKLIHSIKGFSAEVIISFSSDNSENIEEKYLNNSVKFVTCNQKGRAVQMNFAASKAQGDVLIFLHADVIPPELFLEDIMKTIDAGYEAGFFSYQFDSDKFLLKINAYFTASDGIFTGGGDQCLFIKKEAYDLLGGFNEKQVLMEDFEFFNRMKKAKIPYKIVKNDLLVSARKYDNNSYLKVNFCNLIMIILFKLGYPPEKLKSMYSNMLKTS